MWQLIKLDNIYMICKHIDNDRYYLIPVDHEAAYILNSYNRVHAIIKDGRVRYNNKTWEFEDRKIANTIADLEHLIDFVNLGDQFAHFIKKQIIKEAIKKSTSKLNLSCTL